MQKNWQRWFTAAVLELGWSWAGMIVEAAGPVCAEDFTVDRDLLEAFIEYLHRAPLEEQRAMRRTIRLGGDVRAGMPLPQWRQMVFSDLWAHLLECMVRAVFERRYAKVSEIAEKLVLIPAATPAQIYAWQRTVIGIARIIGGIERDHYTDTRTAVDIDAPASAALPTEQDIHGASGVLSAIASATEVSGLHHPHFLFVVRVAFRRAWWPSWRRMGWLWFVNPRVRPLLRHMESTPEKWPPGAAVHLRALLSRHEFPSLASDATWEDV